MEKGRGMAKRKENPEGINMRQNVFAAEVPPSTSSLARPDTSAIETAYLLFHSSPANAKSFALAMHERTAWGHDPGLIEHWANVMTELKRITGHDGD
jgi:hypothetical protein